MVFGVLFLLCMMESECAAMEFLINIMYSSFTYNLILTCGCCC